MFIEGDVFKIKGKEHILRLINKYGGCWLEPIISRTSKTCFSGGLNTGCHYDELSELEYLNVRYGDK